MKVLVACEESQAVTIELRKLGHEAYSCDLMECSGGHPEWHIRWDALALINGSCSFVTMDGELHTIDGVWDMLIAHPPYTQTVQPWMFGHPVQKKTCFWLKGLQPLEPTNIVEERQSTKIPGNWFNHGGKERQKNRAKTFPGIAKAMAEQWAGEAEK